MTEKRRSFILERFFFGWKMGVIVFDEADIIVEIWSEERGADTCVGRNIEQLPESMQELYRKLRQTCEHMGRPVIHMAEDDIYYLAFSDDRRNLFIFGPASEGVLSFSQRMDFRRRNRIANQKFTVPQIALARALNGLSLVYYMWTGRQMTEDAIMRSNCVGNRSNVSDLVTYQIQNIVEEKHHLSYRDEQLWIESIENGALDESVDDRLTPENIERLERVGKFSTASSIKQYEYMVVASTVLASRAAIRGGANAYEVYMLSELFLQKISQCTDTMELLKLHMQVANEFSRMVRQAKTSRTGDCVEQCKDYLARYRTKKFTLSEVAEAVGKSPGYLSRVFSEQTGMTMQEYALDLRLEAAANILRNSDETVGRIAEYLSFPSQSYFGERFKRKYKMSPAMYRKYNKIRDFDE